MTQLEMDQRKHALVLGGSLAGLFAARVLSDHFERVTIVERDPVHDRPRSPGGKEARAEIGVQSPNHG
jgi:2-polyprenyl-6-methoxyphenol hydroxylase-like FAD-dependent oxidoreductase